MELKVQCACGTKYAFDVEPVHGRMPFQVNCPSCGTDGTAQANELIQASLPPPPTVPALPMPSGLRINKRVEPAHTIESREVEVSAPHYPQPQRGRVVLAPEPPQESKLKTAGKVVLIIVLLGVVGATFGYKWFRRIKSVVGVVSTMTGNAADEREWNLWADDSVVLMVRHTNQLEVAQACAEFWQTQLKRKLSIKQVSSDAMEDPDDNAPGREYEVLPGHNGIVEVVGNLDWPEPEFGGLTQFLSRKFNTLAVVHRDVDFSGEFIFGVFEHGEKQFRAEMKLKGTTLADAKEVTSLEKEDWARNHGYKPKQDEDFNIGDAEDITKKLDIRLWDDPARHDEVKQIIYLLREGK